MNNHFTGYDSETKFGSSPLIKQDLQQSTPHSRSARAKGSGRVLLVEDDDTLAVLIVYNLQAKGYVVNWLARGDAVDCFLKQNTIDLIILDWLLPGRSGLDICRGIRADANTRLIPIIMVTALGDSADCAAALSAGADHYIAKPFPMGALVEGVQALFYRSRW